MQLRRWWGWLLAAGLVALGAGLWVWFRVQGRTADAAKIAANMIETWHVKAINDAKAAAAALETDAATNKDKIEVLKNSIARRKAVIEQGYISSGLSTEEIAKRFSQISL